MSEDLRETIDRELYEGSPPMSITAESLLAKGRRDRRNRRLWGATGGLAVLLAAGVAVTNLPGRTGPDPVVLPEAGASSSAPPPEYLMWRGNGDHDEGENDETRRLKTALTAAMGAAGLNVVDMEIDNPVVRGVEELVTVTGADPDPETGAGTGRKRVFYTVNMPFGGGEQGHGWVGVTVYEKGVFVEGGQAAEYNPVVPTYDHLVAGCDDYNGIARAPGVVGARGVDLKVTCQDRTTNDGDRVLVREAKITVDHGGMETLRQVVVYRKDGTAVVLDTQLETPTVDEMLAVEAGLPEHITVK